MRDPRLHRSSWCSVAGYDPGELISSGVPIHSTPAVGPISDLSVVKELLDLRAQLGGEQRVKPATVFREFQAMSH